MAEHRTYQSAIRIRLAFAIALMLPAACSAPPKTLNDAQAKSLFNAKGCNACHAVDEVRIGPSFRDIAAINRGQADAAERLALKIREGGGGAWGSVPMVANPQITPSEATTVSRWILSLPDATTPVTR